ncbi:MAG: TIGR03621 family F420-dependent LLM class oxidoreductase [Chloroflexi bacterium]|nr:TIGR03621 family F420-dependent LLM class oxidoreductase [Chloroflexota bacterium]
MDRRFRFGLVASNAGSLPEWQDIARKAEDLGYSTLFIADHFGAQLAPIPAAMAAAAATKTIRVGTFVLDNDFRHPAAVAKEAATAEMLSSGRFELGIGAGWNAADYRKTGLTFEPAGTRVSKLEESVRILEQFFDPATDKVTWHGKHYQINGLDAAPKAKPKLLLGANGPRMLRLAARHADILNFPDRPPVGVSTAGNPGLGIYFPAQLQIVREAAGARYAQLELGALSIPRVTDKPKETIEGLAKQMQTTPEIVEAMPATLVGSVEAIVEKLQKQRDKSDLSYPVMFLPAIDAMAPVVAKLAGT